MSEQCHKLRTFMVTNFRRCRNWTNIISGYPQLPLGSGRRHTRGGCSQSLEGAPLPWRKQSPRSKITLQGESLKTFVLWFPGFLTPIPATTFSLLTSNERKEEALRRRRSSTLSPPYRGLGWEGTATWRASPSALSHFFSKHCLLHEPCLGAGHGKAGAVRRRMQTLPGNRDLLWTGLGGGREGGWYDLDIILCAWHPRVRRCCRSACLHCTKERQEVRGGDSGD